MTDKDSEISAVVVREQSRLGNFIRSRVGDATEAEDILQDVFYEFVEEYRLPESIEQVSAWLFRVARNRIIDRFRKKKEVSINEAELDHEEYRLDLALPSPEAGPEAEYERAVLLDALRAALDELPDFQRAVFVGHELEGRSFKEMAAESGLSVNTLLARKRYAVLFLRERLRIVYEDLVGEDP
jgi:RNA polymerase sigma factor (sigma-70 family)